MAGQRTKTIPTAPGRRGWADGSGMPTSEENRPVTDNGSMSGSQSRRLSLAVKRQFQVCDGAGYTRQAGGATPVWNRKLLPEPPQVKVPTDDFFRAQKVTVLVLYDELGNALYSFVVSPKLQLCHFRFIR